VQALEALREPGTCRAYNLGCGGEGYSVRDVIETAERVTGRRIPIQTADRRAGDPAVLIASSKRIEHELGWRPQRQQLETIIASAWEHLQQISRAPSEPHHGRPGLLR